ncbi:hypothetical protein HY496_02460 [Candidatus Woesearchaeota archaeon]|nr:hypothetical protein [Candidatus Woesearchaeota archaeon]
MTSSQDLPFETSEQSRTEFINDHVAAKLPWLARAAASEKATKIVNDYCGHDVNALCILSYAAGQGRFDEFVEKLEAHYLENLQYIAPHARQEVMPGTIQTELFLVDCYASLGIDFGV